MLNGAEWCELLISNFKLSDRSAVVRLLICGTDNPPPFTFQHHFESIYRTIWHYCARFNTIQHYSSPFSTLPHPIPLRVIPHKSHTIQHHSALFHTTRTNPHHSALSQNVRYHAALFRNNQRHSTIPRTILHHPVPFRTTTHQSGPSNINSAPSHSFQHHHEGFRTMQHH